MTTPVGANPYRRREPGPTGNPGTKEGTMAIPRRKLLLLTIRFGPIRVKIVIAL
jgi:hypothetical protein